MGAHGVVYPQVMRVDWMQEQKEVVLEDAGNPSGVWIPRNGSFRF